MGPTEGLAITPTNSILGCVGLDKSKRAGGHAFGIFLEKRNESAMYGVSQYVTPFAAFFCSPEVVTLCHTHHHTFLKINHTLQSLVAAFQTIGGLSIDWDAKC